MKITLAFLFSFAVSFCAAQADGNPALKKFSRKWKADINGLKGVRESLYDSISTNYKNPGKGIYIRGFTREQVISLLGKPAGSGRHFEDGGLQMFYPVKKKSIYAKPDIELVIWFDKNDLVSDLARSYNESSKKLNLLE